MRLLFYELKTNSGRVHDNPIVKGIDYFNSNETAVLRTLPFNSTIYVYFDQVPFLTAGEDIGYRKVHFDGTTELSGMVIIQDVQKNDETYTRQMIFQSMKKHIQSEARIVNGIDLILSLIYSFISPGLP